MNPYTNHTQIGLRLSERAIQAIKDDEDSKSRIEFFEQRLAKIIENKDLGFIPRMRDFREIENKMTAITMISNEQIEKLEEITTFPVNKLLTLIAEEYVKEQVRS